MSSIDIFFFKFHANMLNVDIYFPNNTHFYPIKEEPRLNLLVHQKDNINEFFTQKTFNFINRSR